MGRRVTLQVFPVVSQLGELVAADILQSVSKRHFTAEVVVAVGLAIGRDMDQLRPGTVLVKRANESLAEPLTVIQQPLKCNAARNRAIVEEQIDETAGGEA